MVLLVITCAAVLAIPFCQLWIMYKKCVHAITCTCSWHSLSAPYSRFGFFHTVLLNTDLKLMCHFVSTCPAHSGRQTSLGAGWYISSIYRTCTILWCQFIFDHIVALKVTAVQGKGKKEKTADTSIWMQRRHYWRKKRLLGQSASSHVGAVGLNKPWHRDDSVQCQFALQSLEKHLCSQPETEQLIGEEKQEKKHPQKIRKVERGRKKVAATFHRPV